MSDRNEPLSAKNDPDPPSREASQSRVHRIDVRVDVSSLHVSTQQIEDAARAVLEGESIELAELSVAVVDDPTIHELNRQYLQHDYETDVLSFVFEPPPELEGEVIVSVDTASREATNYGWDASSELLLYIVHGTLHLCGYDDKQADARAQMRTAERQYMQQIGRPIPDRASKEASDHR